MVSYCLIRERLDVILPEDDDPDVKAVRKAFHANFTKIADSEMRLDDALSRASNAVSVLRAVSGVDGIGIEPCYFGEIWTLCASASLLPRINTRLSPPAEFMQEQFLGRLDFMRRQWKLSRGCSACASVSYSVGR